MTDVMEMWAAEAARMLVPIKRSEGSPHRGPAKIRQNRCAFCGMVVTAQNWHTHDQSCYETQVPAQGPGSRL